jgi:hypothetical protein
MHIYKTKTAKHGMTMFKFTFLSSNRVYAFR